MSDHKLEYHLGLGTAATMAEAMAAGMQEADMTASAALRALAAILRRATGDPAVVYAGPVGDLLEGPGAFADGLTAAYYEARRVAVGDGSTDDILAALAKLAGVQPK